MKKVVHWVGVDVSKMSFDVALLLNGELGDERPLRALPVACFTRSPEGVEAFLVWLDERSEGVEGAVRCVMETTGRYSMELALWLLGERPGLAPAIVHAKHAADFLKSLGLRTQTDAMAARALAFLGLQRQPEAYRPALKKERELRELSRYRGALVAQQTALKNRMKEHVESCFVVKEYEKQLRRLVKDIARAEKAMRALVEKLPAVKEDIALLESIYGVGFIVANVVRAELGDLRRFEKARQLSAHCGVNPCVRQSGTSVRGLTRMSKQGNKHVRHMLYLAAARAIRGVNDFADDYHRLVAGGMVKKAALGAVMRKILVVMRALIIHRKPYDPNRKRGGKPCGKNAVAPIVQRTAEAMAL